MAVYFYGCISMDGYLATRSHDLAWLYETGTPEETGCGARTLFNSLNYVQLVKARHTRRLPPAGGVLWTWCRLELLHMAWLVSRFLTCANTGSST